MKKIKKIFCLSIAFCMLFAFCGSTTTAVFIRESAHVSSDVCNSILHELKIFERNKSMIGLENVDFTLLYIGEKINVYEYTTDGFNSISEAYLIYENNNIVSLAYKADESNYQIMTNLAISIREANENNSCALVYDLDGCYLYNGNRFISLGYTNIIVDQRERIKDASLSELSELTLTNLNHTRKINYPTNQTYVIPETNYFCSVDYVTQLPYENICWAATIAMIANCVNGTSYDAVDVASGYYSTTDFNKPLVAYYCTDIMNGTYYLNYTYHNYAPSDTVMATNIRNGYPIFGSFSYSGGKHAVAIYGINPIAGRISIMDPETGSRTVYLNSSGQYVYVSSYSGTTLTLLEAICKTW